MTPTKRTGPTGTAHGGEVRPSPSIRALGSSAIGAALLAIVLVGMALWSTPAEADEPAGEEQPQVLVSNLGVGIGGSGGIQRTLHAGRSGFAQAFTTGKTTAGYSLGSVGVQVSHFYDGSIVGDHLKVTINGVANGGGPGDAHCTLVHPSSFSTPGLSAFDAPAGTGSCPQLSAETTYFVVIEWLSPSATGSFAIIPQTFPTGGQAATEEDPGGAEGWSIADKSYYLTVSSNVRTWTAFDETASFKIKVKEASAKDNSPAAGAPTITGTAQAGQTLAVNTDGISDADGLDGVSYEYQWIANDADIEDSTDETYDVSDDDVGKTIKVRVSFTDNGDNPESLTSAATAAVTARPNTPATGLPTISGTAQVGQTLTAGTSGIADEDGPTNPTFTYQWLADDVAINDATESTYKLTDGEEGKAIKVRVSFTDDRQNVETLTSAATPTVAPPPLTVSITTAAPATHDGSTDDFSFNIAFSEEPKSDFSYEVLKSHAFDLTGGTVLRVQRLQRVPKSNIGWMITVLPNDSGDVTVVLPVTTDCDGDEGAICTDDGRKLSNPLEFTVRGPQSLPNSPAAGLPTISGTAQAGQTLTASTTDIADADGPTNPTFSYQWLADDTAISGATSSTYQLADADVGKTIKVRVSFTDDRKNVETLTSAATAAVTARPNSPATGLPTISGTAQAGQTLTASTTDIADADGPTNPTFSYQWLADDTAISGATSSTYQLADADVGKTIKVRVSFTDDRKNVETLTSAATAAVTARPNSPATGLPTISGTPQAGQTLTASTTDIADADGPTNPTFSYQWLADDTAISGATSSTYQLADADVGKTIKVRVSFTDDRKNVETLTSAATAAVTAAPGDGADTEDEDAIWSSTLTAGALRNEHGYDAVFRDPPVGELSSTSFEIDGETYTVKQVAAGWYLYIGLSKELPSGFDFTLEVDGAELDSGDATSTSFSWGHLYKWEEAEIEWEEGDTVKLRLLSAEGDAP